MGVLRVVPLVTLCKVLLRIRGTMVRLLLRALLGMRLRVLLCVLLCILLRVLLRMLRIRLWIVPFHGM